MNLQNRGVYYQLCIYSKIIPFFVEKTAEPAFVVVVVETYPSFAVALRQIAVVVAAAADSAVVAEKLAEFAAAAAAVAVVLAL